MSRNVLVAPGGMFKASLYAEKVMGLELDRNDVMANTPHFRVAFSYLSDDDLRNAMRVFGIVLREFGCGGSSTEALK